MRKISHHKILFLAVFLFILGACSLKMHDESGPAEVYQELLSRLGTGSSIALYAASAVHTPEGLWNVYVLSAPPDRLVFRQSRQGAEIEFGMAPGELWREDVLTGNVRHLEGDWRYFIRSYEIFRLGSQLAKWRVHENQAECRKINAEHKINADLCLLDEFDERVSIQVGADGLPTRISRELPEKLGGGVSAISPAGWTTENGELLMTGFQQTHGPALFDWDIQSVRRIPENQVSIKPPSEPR